MKKIILATLLAAFALTACQKDFLDVNDDPHAVKEPNMDELLAGSLYDAGMIYQGGSYLGWLFPTYTHQLSVRELANYDATSGSAMVGNTWNYAYYASIPSADAIIRQSEADESGEYLVHGAIAKVLKAYVATSLADAWGDVPFSEANVVAMPVVDPSANVYNGALALLDQARATLSNPGANVVMPASAADYYYKGNLSKWVRLINTLELRLLTQTRKAKSSVDNWSSRLTALMSANSFIADGEDWEFPHTATESPSDERNPEYVGEYGGVKSRWISPWLYEIMSGLTYNAKENPFAGIEDPRIPYYWFNQLATAASEAENDTDYRDGKFVSFLFNTNSGNDGNGQASSMSVVGIYPVGGKYDNGAGGRLSISSGTGAAPEKMVQAYSVPFMKAELILTGETTGDARAELSKGVYASIFHVNKVAQAAKGTATVPTITPTTAGVKEFVDAVLAKYDAAAAEKKLEIVMTQKWIANFYAKGELYNDYRRTGYPKLFPYGNGTAVTPYGEDGTPGAFSTVPLKNFGSYPRALYYPNREVETNSNITNQGRDVTKPTVFWDVQ